LLQYNHPVHTEKRIFDENNTWDIIVSVSFGEPIIALFCFVGYYWSENPKPVQVAIFKIGHYPALIFLIRVKYFSY
jgi:hypothetical protein